LVTAYPIIAGDLYDNRLELARQMGATHILNARREDVPTRIRELAGPEGADDIVQETFLRAWRRIGSVTNQGRDIGAWFITIARNIVLDHVKSSRYRLEISTADMLDADQQEDGPEEAVLDRLSNAELLRCVKQLNAEQQECIVLRFLEGLSVAETAAVMEKNEGAIKALQHRAVRRLAGLLPEGFR